ncbi:MAG: response regulator [Bacteroidales bacterium]|nr:response regulator [Bacteroidales bacterium]
MSKMLPILYAEDNENDIELTLAAFKECNLENRVDIVRNGQDALDYLYYQGKFENRDLENPLVIILDVKMPKIDGIKVLEKIKSDENLKNIPVVMLSSSDMENDISNSYRLGANAYVVKPVDFDEFLESVKKIGFFWALINKTT